MKKICFLVGYYPIIKGGAEYQAFLICNELLGKYEIFYISVGHKEETIISNNGLKIFTLKTPRIFNSANAFFSLKTKIINILNSERPDYIYQRVGYAVTGIAAKYCKQNICKLIWHVSHDNEAVRGKVKFSKWFLLAIVEKRWKIFGILNADKIICQTNYQREMIKKEYGRDGYVVRNFHPAFISQIHKPEKINIVWIANFKTFKRPDIFIKLAKKYSNNNSIQFMMIGRLPNKAIQKGFNKAIAEINNFSLLGERPIEEVNQILENSHILVNTSTGEGFPNTFIQAWLREVVVVSLNVDPDNILENEKIGFHSKTFNKMIEDIEIIINDKDLREQIGNRARVYAEKNFNVKDNVLKIEKFMTNRINGIQ